MKNLTILCLSFFLFSNCSSNKLVQKQLLARITASEDRLEIQNLLAGSAFSSDVASEAYWTKMFTDDAVFDRAPGWQDKGREAILKIVNSPDQKEAIKFGMTHLAMTPHITLKGDSAVATWIFAHRDARFSRISRETFRQGRFSWVFYLSIDGEQMATHTNYRWLESFTTHRSTNYDEQFPRYT
jgi:ketosteroid isomerase-like protein